MQIKAAVPEFYPTLNSFIQDVLKEFEAIPAERKAELKKLSSYISERKKVGRPIDLTFICTHNSRRSHIAQILAQTAAAYYNIPHVTCYSGGTEITAFNPNAVAALINCGFKIEKTTEQSNPVYKVYYSNQSVAIIAFSKKYNDSPNPAKLFGAVMTCSEADESCPIVYGADGRFKLPYEDPKLSDGKPEQDTVYLERCKEIGVEMFYSFSMVN